MPYSIASVQRRRISVVVPIGRSSVWSIYLPKSDFIENPYVRKIAIFLGVIETEANHEFIWNLKSDVVQRLVVSRVSRFFQQRSNAKTPRPARRQNVVDVKERQTAV